MTDMQNDIRRIAPGLANASCPLEGIATAGQPSEEQLRRLAENDYKMVLDLRGPAEYRGYDEAAAVRAAGMNYINLPVAGMPDSEIFNRFRQVLRDEAKRPVLVHCASANRVAGLLIPYLVLDRGQEPQAALNTAVSVGLRDRSLAEAALDYVERTQARTNEEEES